MAHLVCTPLKKGGFTAFGIIDLNGKQTWKRLGKFFNKKQAEQVFKQWKTHLRLKVFSRPPNRLPN